MTESVAHPPRLDLRGALELVRYHIVLVAAAAELVFGWLLTGRDLVAIALVVAFDWFFINFLNKITDVEEDKKNRLAGAEWIAVHARPALVGSLLLLAASFVVTHLIWPELTPWRAAVQLIGLGYSFRLVPTPRGLRRFKEIYFFKNFMSAVLFVLTGFVYPLASVSFEPAIGWAAVALLVTFFVPFELTYEILYDLRDLEGDRAEGIPTYPVVHGPRFALRLVDGLLLLCALPLVAGLLTGVLGVREGLFLAAPAAQRLFYGPRVRRGLSGADCIALTHLGTGLLLFYLVGTRIWLALGLPANLYLR
ncbi:MAG: hypothetical protein D6729_18585 [Deltaproteobacteria bacterium]|nr:MAG: hypothetical protein D6729_18585 [Deltaproteobacteria bacterium]